MDRTQENSVNHMLKLLKGQQFSAGHLESPAPSDSRFDTKNEAVNHAVHGSYDDSVWAVWDDENGEIIVVVYQQMVYYP